MKEYILPKTGGVGRIDVLGGNALPDVMALHEATRAALPDDKKRFILPQGSDYFANLLNRVTGLMIGIRAEGQLIAQLALMGPMPLREAIAKQIITHNEVPFHHASLSDSVMVFKSMASNPVWRGNDLSNQLVSFAVDLPMVRITDHMFTQISVGNKRSWDTFLRKHGFGIVSAAYDPDDGLPRFIFQRPSFGFDFEPQIMADDVDPMDDFSAIVSLTQREGLIGRYQEGSTEKMAFQRNREDFIVLPTLARVSA
ncbi:MAG: hypothetical protein PHE27_05315 [Alphaproteobacteria bacterium]|nr:hypothetical protein [Alphaproteobacteria bacterium]